MAEKDPYALENFSYQWAVPAPPPAAPKEAGIGEGLAIAARRAPDIISSQFKSAGAGLVGLGDRILSQIPGGDFGQGDLATEASQGMSRDLTRSAQVDKAYQDYINPLPQSGLGKYSAMLGESLAQSVPALGAGLLTGGTGAAGTMGLQYYGGSRLSQLEQNPNAPVNEGKALLSGVGQAAVDMTLGRFLGGHLNPIDNFAAGIGKSGIGGSATRGFVAGGLRGAAEEGTAEVLQQGIDRWQVGLDVNPFSKSGAFDEYAQSFAAGALLGGGMGGVTGSIGAALDDRRARQGDPTARAFNNREDIGAEGRLRNLMAEQEANTAYDQLNPSMFSNFADQVQQGGANSLAAAELMAQRRATEPLQLPAPDPMAYDPSGATGRPATQEEILLAQQTGGAPGIAPVLALPNPNAAPIEVDSQGVATPTGNPAQVDRFNAEQSLNTDNRTAEADALVQYAATEKRTQSEASSPYETKAMLMVRGKPAYTVTVVGPGSKPDTVKIFNNDTRTVVEVPRKRITSVPEAKDAALLNRIPVNIRRAEEARAKTLHQKQIDAIVNPQSALATVSPLAEVAPPTTAVEPQPETGVSPPPPMAETAPAVQGESSFVSEPVNETAVPLTDQAAPVNETPESIQVEQPPVAEIPQGELPTDPRSNSWIVQDLETGKPVMETFSPEVAAKINTSKYKVWPAYQWLTSLNAASPKGLTETPQNVKKMRRAIGKDVTMPYEERQRLAQIGETQNTDIAQLAAEALVAEMPQVVQAVSDAKNQAAQSTTGPAITNPSGPELAAAAEPMSTTDDDAVFAIQQVEKATLDPNFRSQVMIALREEFRKLGFNGNIPLTLNFTDEAGAAAMFKTEGDKQSIVIALGLANNTKDVPGAVQAMRPFLTHEVVEFAQKYGLIKPEERAVLLDYAKSTKGADGKTLYETVSERYAELANGDTAYLDREAVAYATEYLTRLNPEKWGDSPQNPDVKKNVSSARARNLRRLKAAPDTAQTKAANDFKSKLKAFGSALFKGMSKAYPAKQASGNTLAQDIALRLAKGDIAHRARINPRFVQEVKFAGWAVPPTQVQQLGKQLRHYLDSMGLPDVGLRLSTAILKPDGKTWTSAAEDTLGSYHARTITISMANYNPDITIEENLENLIKVVDHEAVHALRATGAWTPSQWLNLVSFVRNAKDFTTNETYFEKAQRQYGAYVQDMQPAVAQDVLNEEAVAMAFADNFDIDIPRPTGPQRLLDRIAQTHLGIANAMHAVGIRSPEMIMANGANTFQAVRAGEAAKARREYGASSPAEMAVKFALAESKTEKVNPAMEPDLQPAPFLTKLFDATYRARNPLAAYIKPDARAAELTNRRQREQSVLLRIPFLGGLLDPRATMADPDLFTLLRSETLGSIDDQNKYIVGLKLKAEKIVGSNAKLEKAVRDYMTTKGADPSMIPDAKLADIVAEMKTMVSTVGRNLVELGLLSKESFEAMDGSYLHRRYLDSANAIFSSTRLVHADLGFTKQRTNPNIAERAAKGEEVDTLTSVTAYLAKATHAMYIANMHQTILGTSAMEDPNVRHWVIGAEDTVVWNGKRNSPFAVEAEIDSNLQSIQELQANLGLAKNTQTAAKNKAKLETANAQVAGKARVLLRNKLWLGRKGANPTQVVEALGIQLSQNGTVDADALTNVSDEQVIQLFSQIRSGGVDFSNVQRKVVWREKVWSVLDMEKEIARIEEDVYTATEPTGPDDAIRIERLKLAKDSVRTGKIELMRNTLWQNLRQVNPEEVVAELGDFSEEAVNRAYDNLRIRHAVNSYAGEKGTNLDAVARGLASLQNYVAGVTMLSDNVVQVPDTARWGGLRGMMMAREVYDIMNGTGSVIENTVDNQRASGNNNLTMAKVVQQMMAVFKGSSTVLNPGTHVTNWAGNMLQGSVYGGVDPVNWTKHVGVAFSQVLNADGEAYNALRERGGARGSNALADISLVTDPMRNSMERAALEVLQDFDIEALKADPVRAGKAFLKLGTDLGKAGYSRIADFYQLSDTVMKVALMRCHMERGLSADEAFLNAQDVFFDYGMVPPFIRAMRNMPIIGAPFISWSYMATALTVNSLGAMTTLRRFADGSELKIPSATFLAFPILAYQGAQAAMMAADDMEDEDRKYLTAGLPDFAKGGFGYMYSGLDANGRPVMTDFLKYASFGTLVKVAYTANEMQTTSNEVGVTGVLKELGFLGSDPGFQIMNAVLQQLNSGKDTAKVGSLGGENPATIIPKIIDVFLPPNLRGLADGTNPIVGKSGLMRSTPFVEGEGLPYQNGRPALSFWQKAAKIGGFGIYVVDIVPALENREKQSKAMIGTIKTETRRITNDAYLSEDEKTQKLNELETRTQRIIDRHAEDKAMLEEVKGSEFYRNYRENVMAMGLPDPVITNAANKKLSNTKIKDRDYRAIWQAVGVDTSVDE